MKIKTELVKTSQSAREDPNGTLSKLKVQAPPPRRQIMQQHVPEFVSPPNAYEFVETDDIKKRRAKEFEMKETSAQITKQVTLSFKEKLGNFLACVDNFFEYFMLALSLKLTWYFIFVKSLVIIIIMKVISSTVRFQF